MAKRNVLMLAVVLAACETIDCTLIGCSSGLIVSLPAGTRGPLTVNLVSSDAGTRSIPCNSDPCIGIMAENYTPQSVRVEVVSTSGTTVREFTPSYTQSRPNGPKCGPTCVQATVQFN